MNATVNPPERDIRYTDCLMPGDPLIRLVERCEQLQREAGDNPFALSYANAAAVERLPISLARTDVRYLVRRGVLQLVEPARGRTPSRYRLVHS